MAKRLAGIQDWPGRAHAAQYRVGVLAKHCGVSPKTLERHIKLFYGRCPREWLQDLLMARALELLKECDSIKAVAGKLGYDQPQNFSRDFKQHTGHTPSGYYRATRARA